VITHTGEILNTSATNKNYAMLLEIVSDSWNVSRNFDSVGKTYSGNFTESRVRLLRCGSLYGCANAALLWRILVSRLTLHRVITL
jgi:hypothetical protein